MMSNLLIYFTFSKPLIYFYFMNLGWVNVKGIQAVRIDFFLFMLKVANIRCCILIKCSEQKDRFTKSVMMS